MLVAGATAAVKTSYLPGIGKFKDITFQIVNLLIWSDAETAVTILAASIPFFRVLIRNSTSRGGVSDPYRQSYRLESQSNLKNSARQSRGFGITGGIKGASMTRGRMEEMSDSSSLGEILPIQGSGIVKGVTVKFGEDKQSDTGP